MCVRIELLRQPKLPTEDPEVGSARVGSGGLVQPKRGFALHPGWTAGQLESEMRDNAWLTVPADESLIFDTPPADRWEAAARLVGVDPSRLPDYAGHA